MDERKPGNCAKYVLPTRIRPLDMEATAAQQIAPGVTDDGSGTAAVMELARVMSQYQFDKTIVFIAFAAEEIGLSGSQTYAAMAKQTGMQIEAVLNNDIIGSDVARERAVGDQRAASLRSRSRRLTDPRDSGAI